MCVNLCLCVCMWKADRWLKSIQILVNKAEHTVCCMETHQTHLWDWGQKNKLRPTCLMFKSLKVTNQVNTVSQIKYFLLPSQIIFITNKWENMCKNYAFHRTERELKCQKWQVKYWICLDFGWSNDVWMRNKIKAYIIHISSYVYFITFISPSFEWIIMLSLKFSFICVISTQ